MYGAQNSMSQRRSTIHHLASKIPATTRRDREKVDFSQRREEKEQLNYGQGTTEDLLQQCCSLQAEEEGTRRQNNNNEGVVQSAVEQRESGVSGRSNVNYANHLHADFFLERNTTSFNSYIRLHKADGLNSSNSNFIGISFKSSECIFLWNFLRSIGVEAPKLNFQLKRDTFSKKFGAGFHGAVRWGFRDKITRDAIWSLVYPSSHITDSVPGLIEGYFADEDPIKLIVFFTWFLFW